MYTLISYESARTRPKNDNIITKEGKGQGRILTLHDTFSPNTNTNRPKREMPTDGLTDTVTFRVPSSRTKSWMRTSKLGKGWPEQGKVDAITDKQPRNKNKNNSSSSSLGVTYTWIDIKKTEKRRPSLSFSYTKQGKRKKNIAKKKEKKR